MILSQFEFNNVKLSLRVLSSLPETTWAVPDDIHLKCTWSGLMHLNVVWFGVFSKVFACLLSLELDNYVVIFTPRSRLLVAQIPAQINVVQSSRRCTGNFFNIDSDQVLIPEICLSLSKTDVSNWIFLFCNSKVSRKQSMCKFINLCVHTADSSI